MNRRKRQKLNRLLIRRDGYICGSHVGGCGIEAASGPETDLDHIFPRAFFRDTKSLNPTEYDSPWNLQRMHKVCNGDTKGGFLFGFPLFKCKCHWLRIKKRREKYALEVSYRPSDADIRQVIVVPYGKFQVGDGRISDPKGLLPPGQEHILVGYVQVPDRGMSISSITVDLGAAFTGGRKSFSFVGKERKGTLRKGENGHVFPLLATGEVNAFNQFEENRVKREGGNDDDANLLITFNSEVVRSEIKYDEWHSGRI